MYYIINSIYAMYYIINQIYTCVTSTKYVHFYIIHYIINQGRSSGGSASLGTPATFSNWKFLDCLYQNALHIIIRNYRRRGVIIVIIIMILWLLLLFWKPHQRGHELCV